MVEVKATVLDIESENSHRTGIQGAVRHYHPTARWGNPNGPGVTTSVESYWEGRFNGD
jgi:hypothetical protein